MPRHSAVLRRLGLTLLALLALLCAAQAPAQGDAAALQIKAAFLHKFAAYVQGPGTVFEQSGTPLVFGIAGSESIHDFLAQLVAAQSGDMRAAEVRFVTGVDDLAGVHVLFVGESAPEADELLRRGVQASMLTVTDSNGARPSDSMIHFFVADDRVRFDIALAPASAAGLRLSSRLLQVARRVENENGGID